MPMREECKHFQSRTYGSGETARWCELDLAPEAPWRCPEDCPKFERRLVDVGWDRGTLVSPALEPAPDVDLAEAARLLDEAEDVINTAGPGILADVERERAKERPAGDGLFNRIFGRFRRPR